MYTGCLVRGRKHLPVASPLLTQQILSQSLCCHLVESFNALFGCFTGHHTQANSSASLQAAATASSCLLYHKWHIVCCSVSRNSQAQNGSKNNFSEPYPMLKAQKCQGLGQFLVKTQPSRPEAPNLGRKRTKRQVIFQSVEHPLKVFKLREEEWCAN